MSSSSAMSLKSRITQMFWVGNAVVCAFLALLGTAMSFGVFGYDEQLPALAVRAGATIAIAGAALAVFSLWRARSVFGAR